MEYRPKVKENPIYLEDIKNSNHVGFIDYEEGKGYIAYIGCYVFNSGKELHKGLSE